MTYKGIAKGKTIELEEPLPYEEGQAITISVQPASPGPLRGSPAAVLEALRKPPHVTAEDVAELERAIRESQLPVSEGGIFDDEE
jgi:hypothetical protein